MIDAALFDRLTGDPALTGVKIAAETSTAKGDYPMVVYQQVAAGTEETRTVNGPVTTFRTLQQFDIYAQSRRRAIEIANAVRARLDGPINQTWGGLSIKASRFDDQRDGAFEDVPGLTGLVRIIQQYRITYTA